MSQWSIVAMEESEGSESGMLEVTQAGGRSGDYRGQVEERENKVKGQWFRLQTMEVKLGCLGLLNDGVPPTTYLGSGNRE